MPKLLAVWRSYLYLCWNKNAISQYFRYFDKLIQWVYSCTSVIQERVFQHFLKKNKTRKICSTCINIRFSLIQLSQSPKRDELMRVKCTSLKTTLLCIRIHRIGINYNYMVVLLTMLLQILRVNWTLVLKRAYIDIILLHFTTDHTVLTTYVFWATRATSLDVGSWNSKQNWNSAISWSCSMYRHAWTQNRSPGMLSSIKKSLCTRTPSRLFSYPRGATYDSDQYRYKLAQNGQLVSLRCSPLDSKAMETSLKNPQRRNMAHECQGDMHCIHVTTIQKDSIFQGCGKWRRQESVSAMAPTQWKGKEWF